MFLEGKRKLEKQKEMLSDTGRTSETPHRQHCDLRIQSGPMELWVDIVSLNFPQT